MEAHARGFRDTAVATAATHTVAVERVLEDYRRRLCLQFGVDAPVKDPDASPAAAGGGSASGDAGSPRSEAATATATAAAVAAPAPAAAEATAAAAAPAGPARASSSKALVPSAAGGSSAGGAAAATGGSTAKTTGGPGRRPSLKGDRSTPKLGAAATVDAERVASEAAAAAAEAAAALESLRRSIVAPPHLCQTLKSLADVYADLEVRCVELERVCARGQTLPS